MLHQRSPVEKSRYPLQGDPRGQWKVSRAPSTLPWCWEGAAGPQARADLRLLSAPPPLPLFLPAAASLGPTLSASLFSFGVTAHVGKHSRGKWILSFFRQLAKKKRFCKDRKFSLHFYNMPQGFVLPISRSAGGKGPMSALENTGFPFHLCSAFWAVWF